MIRTIGLLFILFLPFSCTSDFEDINTNQNAPAEVQPELLFRQVIYGYGDAMAYEGFVAGNLLSQHFAMIDFNLFDRHALASPQEGGNPWPILYTALRDNETILEIARENPAQSVYEGPALVMKAYLSMTLTDMFGDVPYFEAFQGRSAGVTTPSYDRQEDIYLADGGILDNLLTAFDLLDNYPGTQPLRGDILYDGDLSGWVQFARLLYLKALVRIGDREPIAARVSANLTSVPILSNNGENATFRFTAGPPNNYPLTTARVGIFNVFLMSQTAASIFAELNDPRVERLYRPAANSGTFTGIANGIDAASAIVPDDFARPGTIFREDGAQFQFHYATSWERFFLMAEAAQRGWINMDPQGQYEIGVKQAFEYWGVAMPADYLTTGPAAWDPARGLEQIMTQKWIANAGNAYEAWTDWRRTGFPRLAPVEASLNDNLIPIRMPYPSEEQALNFENYSTAAAATDGNSINVPVWWDR
ncbi:SusD/RagB family nutrient-binding outer membrane lipoprotein [Lewinella sp. 4G2]|uniref:SusD/RagB family nutrient-binding outer membrane lipoprotein n=1 Tax=Lewinella sp. 4G2 TaxID=1803372 RepID=UPI0007B4ABCA|nr:SusD/RagB family nutrient-binding outer membrane lipoprotein [Lewinella sp. 4G2]OAV45863.1 hypothetical protein A3850_009105 [Lewinella sp. 4G2]